MVVRIRIHFRMHLHEWERTAGAHTAVWVLGAVAFDSGRAVVVVRRLPHLLKLNMPLLVIALHRILSILKQEIQIATLVRTLRLSQQLRNRTVLKRRFIRQDLRLFTLILTPNMLSKICSQVLQMLPLFVLLKVLVSQPHGYGHILLIHSGMVRV